MIPQDCVHSAQGSQTLHQTLYEQLGPGYTVIQHLTLPKKLNGSLLWIQYQQQSLFLYLSNSKDRNFSFNKAKNNLKDLVKNSEIVQLLKLQQKLLPKQLKAHKAQLTPFLVLFTNISKNKLNIGIKSLGLYLYGRESLEDGNLAELIYKNLGKPNTAIIHHHIRHIFSPETRLTYNKPLELSELSHCLLDDEQEAAIKSDIFLPKEKRRINNYNLTGINGGTTCGKSEALITRTKLIREIHPENNLLILTINKASTHALKERYSNIAPDDTKTKVLYFNQWCNEQLKMPNNLVYVSEINEIIESLISPRLKKNGISLATFFHELDFIHGRTIFYENEYLKAIQTSQPYHLNKEHYPHIWKSVLTLKSELSIRGWTLWSELPQLLWDSIQKDPFSRESFDHILMDDAHYFPPIAFELIKTMLKPTTGQLFITQDPNQGIINPCMFWQDTGLDLRDHCIRLNHHYKINPTIINAANAFSLNRLPDETDKDIIRDIPQAEENPIPELLHFHSLRDEENRLLNELKKHIQNNTILQDILVITPNDETSRELANLIESTLKITVERLDEHHSHNFHQRNGIGICHFMQAQGLVVPFVFIFGLEQLFESEKNLNTGTNEYQALLIENTRKLSMAMTRANKELTLFMLSENIPEDFISPHINIPTVNTTTNAEVHYLRKSS